MTDAMVDKAPQPRLDPLAQRIVTLMHEKRLQAGDPMPTELDLIDELGVSRNSVREAVRALRALGIVDIRHGHGTFVGAAALHALSPSLIFRALTNRTADGLQGLRDLVGVRELVEVGVIEQLAGTLDTATLDRLSWLCKEMEHTDLDPAVDREFHRTLYAGLDNPLVGQLVDLFWDAYREVQSAISLPANKDIACTVEQHRQIVETLRAGDPAAARAAMVSHFADINQRLNA
jgi:DNA-binding FadR family transcriptional regulator